MKTIEKELYGLKWGLVREILSKDLKKEIKKHTNVTGMMIGSIYINLHDSRFHELANKLKNEIESIDWDGI